MVEKLEESDNNLGVVKKTISRMFVIKYHYSCKHNHSSSLGIILSKCKDIFVEILEDDSINPEELYSKSYFNKLMKSIETKSAEAKSVISKFAARDLESHSMLIISILEVGVSEYLALNIPKKVLINEYTNIASMFVDSAEVDFINAILDKIVNDTKFD